MKTRLLCLGLMTFLFTFTSNAQVGVGNTNPQAQLHISASNTTTPANTDGILIPRVANLPTVGSMTANQDGMMVFYTGTGANGKGFYYWNQTTTSWEKIASGGKNTLDEAYDEGGAGAGRIITADNGPVQISGINGMSGWYTSSNAIRNFRLTSNGTIDSHDVIQIDNNTTSAALARGLYSYFSGTYSGEVDGFENRFLFTGNADVSGFKNDFRGYNNSNLVGLENIFDPGNTSLKTGNHIGVYNQFDNILNTDGTTIGVQNSLGASGNRGNGVRYGVLNTVSMIGTGIKYGVRNDLNGSSSATGYGIFNSVSKSGSGDRYASYSRVSGTGTGIGYGVYAQATATSDYAGYFIGRTSLGTATTNRYLMPAADGTLGQVMTTDGAGNVSFQTPATGSDNQTIDNFSLVGNQLRLSLENDGQPLQTVDLSSLNTDDADWYRENTTTTPNNINDNIFTQGRVAIGTNSTNGNYNLTSESLSGNTQVLLGNRSNAVPGAEIEVTGAGANGLRINLAGAQNSSDRYAVEANVSGGLTSKLGFLDGAPVNALVGQRNDMTMGGFYTYRGMHNLFSGTSTDPALTHHGVYNYLTGNISGLFRGVENRILGGGGNKTGLYNFFGNNAGGFLIGHSMTVSGSNNSAGYIAGLTVSIPSTVTATNQYGIYSDVTRANGYSGYFLGRVSVGTTTANNYILPPSRGTTGQVMTMGTGGSVTFQTLPNQDNSASNGLNEVGSDIRLGGALTQNTTITQNAFDLNFSLTSSAGNFTIDTNTLVVESSGDTGFGIANPEHPLHVVDNVANEVEGVYVDKNDNTTQETNGIYVEKTGAGTGRSHAIRTRNDGTGTGQKYGVFNTISATSSGNQYGTRNFMAGASPSGQFATFNNLDNNGTGNHYGVYNGMRGASAANLYGVYNEFERAYTSPSVMVGVRNRFTNGIPGTSGMNGVWTDFTTPTNGNFYGVRNEFGTGATGTGNKYGTYNLISSSAGGTHYGTFNQVASANGWAGYFVGRSYMSERLGIGENNNTVGRLAIATNSGGSNVHIELKETGGNDGARVRFSNPSEDATNWWTMYGRIDNTDAESQFNIFYGGTGTNLMRLEGDGDLEFTGNLSVNLNNPTYAIQLPNNTAIGLGRGRANAWTTYSDSRVKSNQQVLENGLSLINQMTPKTYFHHNGNIEEGLLNLTEDGEHTLGFIAQELYEILPEAVQKPEDENVALWSVNYNKVIPVAVKAIQELSSKVESLEAENKNLKQKLSKLEQLEARLSALETKSTNSGSETANATED